MDKNDEIWSQSVTSLNATTKMTDVKRRLTTDPNKLPRTGPFNVIKDCSSDINDKRLSSSACSQYKGIWSNEEDSLLLHLKNVQKLSTWVEIACYFPGRNAKQCAYRYKKIFLGKDKGNWTREEDLKLLELVEYFGEDFEKIKPYFSQKTEKEIQSRYFKKINPQIITFTNDEDKIILSMYQNRKIDELDKIILNKKGAISVKRRLELLLKLRGEDIDDLFNIHDYLPSVSYSYEHTHDNSSNRRTEDDLSVAVSNTALMSNYELSKEDKYACRKTNEVFLDSKTDLFSNFDDTNLNVYYDDYLKLKEKAEVGVDNYNTNQNQHTPTFKMSNINLPNIGKNFNDIFSNENKFPNFEDDKEDDTFLDLFTTKSETKDFYMDIDCSEVDNFKKETQKWNHIPSIKNLLDKKNNLESILDKTTQVTDIFSNDLQRKVSESRLPLEEKTVMLDLFSKVEKEDKQAKLELTQLKICFSNSNNQVQEKDFSEEIVKRINNIMKQIEIAKLKLKLLSKVNVQNY